MVPVLAAHPLLLGSIFLWSTEYWPQRYPGSNSWSLWILFYVTKRTFAGVIKQKTWNGKTSLDFPSSPKCSHKYMGGRGRFDLRGWEGNVTRATDRSDTLWKDHQPRDTGGVTGRWKRQGNILSWSLQKEPAVPTFWYLTLWKWFQTSDLQNYQRINPCCFESLSWWCFVTVAIGNWYNCVFILPLLFYTDLTSTLLLPSLNVHTTSKWGIREYFFLNQPWKTCHGVGDLTLPYEDKQHFHTKGKMYRNNSVRTATVV